LLKRVSAGFPKKELPHPIHKDKKGNPKLKAHKGHDFPEPQGTPIVYIGEKGIIRKVVNKCSCKFCRCGGGYGNYVEIINKDGSKILFAHLYKVDVKVGETIRPGRIIGEVGTTGMSTGPHIHLEYKAPYSSKKINPLPYANKYFKVKG